MSQPGWGPPPAPPRAPRRPWGAAVGAVVAALVTGLGIVTAVVVVRTPPSPRASPVSTPLRPARSPDLPATVTPSPSPTPSPAIRPATAATPTQTTTPRATPIGPDRSLKSNSIYDIDLGRGTVTCPITVRDPRPPLKNSQLADYLRSVVDCLTRTFTAGLTREGFALVEPRIKTYAKKAKTPCGTYGQDVAPAYYCSATRTIYWPHSSDEGHEAYTYARLGYLGLTAHEYGHHLQAASGILLEYAGDYDATAKKADKYALSRRLELQAQCFEGVFLAAVAKSIKLSAKDRVELREWHSYTGDEDPPRDRKPDHGTSAAQIRWLDRGLDSADLGRCNTWAATKKAVS